MSTPFVEVKDLRRSFDGVHAVDGISFNLEAGHVTGLIGANGAGKTTTMRMLATLDLPNSGTIRLGGLDVVEHPNAARRRLGWMPDHFTPYKSTSVVQYLDFFARAQGLKGAALRQRLDETSGFANLGPLRNRPMDKLSKGEMQRLSLARTLLSDPEFLIMDEPVAGLDPKARLEFKHLVRILSERGKTILISSHILSELAEMCDTLLFMHRGRVVHHGETHTLRKADAHANRCVLIIVVAGPVDVLIKWIKERKGWDVIAELHDGVRAEFTSGDPDALRAELQQMLGDGVRVVEYHREERRLEETFVEMLREPAEPARH
jgi:ABC-2 type transport system ATP-binding protein